MGWPKGHAPWHNLPDGSKHRKGHAYGGKDYTEETEKVQAPPERGGRGSGDGDGQDGRTDP